MAAEADTPERGRRRLSAIEVTILAVTLPVVAVVGLAYLVQALSPNRPTPAFQPPVPSNAIVIPGLYEVNYIPGLADRFASYKTATVACAHWQRLSDSERRGLAFVDAKVVPKCASSAYVKQAEGEHRVREASSHQYGQPEVFDLGSPELTTVYTGETYSCHYLTRLTANNYFAPAVPKEPDYAPETAATQKQWEALSQWQASIYPIEEMYEFGGNFSNQCYLPGAVFGQSKTGQLNSLQFYPNHPVRSMREAAAPVFYSPGGSNVTGTGKRYVVKYGDNPSSVATTFYNDWSEWTLIIAANHLSTPLADGSFDLSKSLTWYPGLVIYLPGAE